MSTTLLVRSFGLVGYHHVGEHFEGGATIFRIDQPRDRLRCSQCSSENVWIAGRTERGFRDYEFFKLKILGLHETKRALVG
jgi:hypothetical protein